MTTTRYPHNPISSPGDLWPTLALGLAGAVMGWLVVIWMTHPYELSPYVPDGAPVTVQP